MKPILRALVLVLLVAAFVIPAYGDDLAAGFATPPDSARPRTWWHWLNGCVSKQGITADLEAMKRVGLAGATMFNIDQLPIDDPSITVLNPKWREMIKFATQESARLGLELGFENTTGWSASGGPWITPPFSMQTVVSAGTLFSGPGKFTGKLARPNIDPKWNYYQDIAVLAYPRTDAEPIDPKAIVDLTDKFSDDASLNWDAPAGNWMIVRFGYTTTGKINAPSPVSGRGLECDKFNPAALDVHFAAYPAQILAEAGDLVGKSMTGVTIDSYEAKDQNWSPVFRAAFKTRRDYDVLPWLPLFAKKTIADKAISDRVQWDITHTIEELFADDYYGHMAELVHKYPNVLLSIEPYKGPFDTLTVGGRADIPMSEFWAKPSKAGWDSVRPTSSAAHTWGKNIIAAESFTGLPVDAWQNDPYALKSTGDRAFCMGVNRITLHTTPHQPWMNVAPGMTAGYWGTQFGRTVTWWDHGASEWIKYLTRCQYLLQQGHFAADICYLAHERYAPPIPAGYDADTCGEEAFLTRMTVKNGLLEMPDGMTYRVLVLPEGPMLPAVARKIKQLVSDGATVVGPKPTQSPSYQDYPACDSEVAQIGDEVWGNINGTSVTEHAYGKGRVVFGKPVESVLPGPDVQFSPADSILWIHRHMDDADIYFVSNQSDSAVSITASFRIAGKLPELWHGDTGQTEPASGWSSSAGRTTVPLKFDPSGSVFVVFRQPADTKVTTPVITELPAVEIAGPWSVAFPPHWGAPAEITLDKLISWPDDTDPGVKYFSGTATYSKTISIPPEMLAAHHRVFLDLGVVKNLAEVTVNDARFPALWKPPFRVDVTAALHPGQNHLQIQVTNLWPNRLIGDEQQPDDCQWGAEESRTANKARIIAGRPLAVIPQWLLNGTPRPSQGRYAFTTFKYYTKDSPLLESGLIGPVTLNPAKAE